MSRLQKNEPPRVWADNRFQKGAALPTSSRGRRRKRSLWPPRPSCLDTTALYSIAKSRDVASIALDGAPAGQRLFSGRARGRHLFQFCRTISITHKSKHLTSHGAVSSSHSLTLSLTHSLTHSVLSLTYSLTCVASFVLISLRAWLPCVMMMMDVY